MRLRAVEQHRIHAAGLFGKLGQLFYEQIAKRLGLKPVYGKIRNAAADGLTTGFPDAQFHGFGAADSFHRKAKQIGRGGFTAQHVCQRTATENVLGFGLFGFRLNLRNQKQRQFFLHGPLRRAQRDRPAYLNLRNGMRKHRYPF